MSGLELGPMMGGMKETGGQQSRFKWMMEGHSPAPSPPNPSLHKNGGLTNFTLHLSGFCSSAID